MKNKFKLVFLGLGIFLFSCKKDETVTPAAATTKELLTSNTWRVTNYATASIDTAATNAIGSWKRARTTVRG